MMSFFDDLFIPKATEETENGFTVKVCCNPSHPVYQAHFPGNPITPGACVLLTANRLLRLMTSRSLYLKSSKNIKFLSILTPAEGKEISFVFSRIEEGEAECKVQVVVADQSTVYSKMSLTYSYEPI